MSIFSEDPETGLIRTPPEPPSDEQEAAARLRATRRRYLVLRFRSWLDGLSDDQIAALEQYWANILDDATLFRVDSWVIAQNALDRLRSGS